MKKSIIRRILILMLVQIILSIFAFGVFIFFSYIDTKREILQSSKNFVQVYGKEISNRLDRVDVVLENIIYQNSDLLQLESPKELERYYASRAVSARIKEVLATDRSAEILVVAEGEYEICLDAQSMTVTYEQRQAVRQFIMEATGKEHNKVCWEFAEIGERAYIYKMYKKDRRIEAAFISADSLLDFIQGSDYGSLIFTLSDGNHKKWATLGEEVGTTFYEEVQEELVEGQVYLSAYVNTYNILKSAKYSVYVIAFLTIVNVLYVILTEKYIRKQLLKPMQKIIGVMDGIRSGNYRLRIEGEFTNQEFCKLKDTFNILMDEIIALRIRKYEKQLELKDMEIKCVRLTLRPHFFLNAVTTISSLSMQRKNEQIIAYVNALSRTIRYMFRSGLHTVFVGEEIEHVENYFEMQELKYPGAVFHFVEIEDSCTKWKIPQLIIHTLIENEYKYAVVPERTLTILISVKTAVHDGEEMLLLEIEDDGKGYPEEMFSLMKEEAGSYPASGKRIGIWSIRKMLNLMYARDDLFQIENVAPHGCMNQILIPRQAVHEIKEETIQNKIE